MSEKSFAYIETYGCQMNVSDSEVIAALLRDAGYGVCSKPEKASLIIVNTCSVRDNAEQRIWGRLAEFRSIKRFKPELVICVVGCMAERLQSKLIDEEQIVDIVAGPDSYRNFAELIELARSGQKSVNIELSREETYAEIEPVRYDSNGVTAFVSIMRGCNNRCSYCVVPYTRGVERSRSAASILSEVRQLADRGYREVTLLGQNVNSYRDRSVAPVNFADLLRQIAEANPKMRIRFSTSHPKDINEELLHTIAAYRNICKSIHLPVQSGSNRILELMNRRYTREDYLSKIAAIRRILPDAAISTDIIAGFCSETESDHLQTLQLMRQAGYDFAYMFMYSERSGTPAANKLKDNVSDAEKTRRLNEIIGLQNTLSLQSKQRCISGTYEVLAEGASKRSREQLFGRTSQNQVVVFPAGNYKPGDYLNVRIARCTSATLVGELV